MNKTNTDTIRLFAFGTGWGVPFPTSAPFPLKLDCWLRMAGIPFEFVIANDPSKGPKGKSPWVEINGEAIADSSVIIELLQQRYGIDLDSQIDDQQRAIAVSVQRMLEEHYHQCFEHQLFFGTGAQARLSEFASTMPVPLRWLVPTVLKKTFKTQLYARGMGRHDEAIIIAQGKADLDTLSQLLGDRDYFFGDEPSSIDACVFGFLGVSLYVEGDNPLYRYGASLENLMRYCERMRARYYPETFEALPAMFPEQQHMDQQYGTSQAKVA